MENKTTIQETDVLDAFYRERWEKASGLNMAPETEKRIFRALGKRIGGEVRRLDTGVWWRYAAAVFIGAVIAISALFSLRRPAAETPVAGEFTVFSAKGQRANITLPDGTQVWLNSHTKITCPRDYGQKERRLSLEGEAYFEVAKDSTRRFLVNAGEMTVEALGTSFNVKAYNEDKDIVATLFTGSVQVNANGKRITLAPEQYALFNRKSGRLDAKTAENATYAALWRDNELVFDRTTLDEIAVLFDRMYNVTVLFQSEKVRRYRFSGVIKNNSLDNVFEIISLSKPITYEYKGDTIVLGERKIRN